MTTGPVDVLCSQPHYGNHLSSIWFGLPPEARGTWWAAGICADRGNTEGVPGWRRGYPPRQDRPVMVAGYMDEIAVDAPIIYLEHGAGQTYRGDSGSPHAADHESYSGSGGHDRAILFLCPSETVADRWRGRYPTAAAVAVGVPKLDWWHAHPGAGGGGPHPVLAITFHSDNRLISEAVSAWRHYEPGLTRAVDRIRAEGWQVLGHGHPRLWQKLRVMWGQLGVEAVEDFGEILSRADVLAFDNTSAGYEFASTGRPVVVMNAPWFRRNIHHGLRFWDLIPGAQIDGPGELPDAAVAALAETETARETREKVTRQVYVATDGKATDRAVAAILSAI